MRNNGIIWQWEDFPSLPSIKSIRYGVKIQYKRAHLAKFNKARRHRNLQSNQIHPQENNLYEVFTPYEFLKFILSLKVSDSNDKIKKRIEEVLEQFKLSSVKHSLIGGFIVRGLSGDEKKRLSIASEVLLYPSVIILDEATSGLDSFMAMTVLSILKDASESGVTVIMIIHQPSYEIYEMIDRLALMQLGEFVYQGKASEALNYFREAGFEAPHLVNPPEFFMKLLRIEDRNNISEQESRIAQLLT